MNAEQRRAFDALMLALDEIRIAVERLNEAARGFQVAFGACRR